MLHFCVLCAHYQYVYWVLINQWHDKQRGGGEVDKRESRVFENKIIGWMTGAGEVKETRRVNGGGGRTVIASHRVIRRELGRSSEQRKQREEAYVRRWSLWSLSFKLIKTKYALKGYTYMYGNQERESTCKQRKWLMVCKWRKIL